MNSNEAIVTFYLKDKESVNLNCEVDKSITSKMKGLMYREFLPDDQGMLFPFFFQIIDFFG